MQVQLDLNRDLVLQWIHPLKVDFFGFIFCIWANASLLFSCLLPVSFVLLILRFSSSECLLFVIKSIPGHYGWPHDSFSVFKQNHKKIKIFCSPITYSISRVLPNDQIGSVVSSITSSDQQGSATCRAGAALHYFVSYTQTPVFYDAVKQTF